MAFSIVAQLQIQGPANLSQISQKIQRSLGNINANVGLTIDKAAVSQLASLNQQTQTLAATLQAARTGADATQAAISKASTQFQKATQAATNLSSAGQKANVSLRSTATVSAEAATGMAKFADQAALATRRYAAFAASAGSILLLLRTFKNAIGESLRFQQQLVRVSQIGNSTSADIQALGNSIRGLSSSYGINANELAKAALQFRKAGQDIIQTQQALEAVSKAGLSPNFDNIEQTTDAAITAMKQFKLEASDLEKSLGAINAVASNFSVSGSEITDVIKKAGTEFRATGGSLEELVGLFAAIKSTTHESSDSIATGLRTIFTKIQKNENIEALKAFQIQLRYTSEEAAKLGNTNLAGQFVGAYEAIRRVTEGLAKLSPTDPRFVSIAARLGGRNELQRIITLTQNLDVAERAKNQAMAGGVLQQIQAGKQLDSLGGKYNKLKGDFDNFVHSLVQSTSFQTFAKGLLDLGNAAVFLANGIRPLIPLLTALAAIKIGQSVFAAVPSFTGRLTAGARNAPRMATGGTVLGSGSGDKIPAMLEPGEFVIRKHSARSIGYGRLHQLNQSGEEVAAAKGYYVDGSFRINHKLRTGEVVDRNADQHAQVLEKHILSQEPHRESKVFYRGIRKDAADKIFGKNPVGQSFRDAGFTSTSEDIGVAQEFAGKDGVVLRLVTRRGTRSASMSDAPSRLAKLQKEHVFSPGRTTSIFGSGRTKSGHTLYHAELFSRGGQVGGSGLGDKIPALLEPDEFVLPRVVAQAIGNNTLERLRQGDLSVINKAGEARVRAYGDPNRLNRHIAAAWTSGANRHAEHEAFSRLAHYSGTSFTPMLRVGARLGGGIRHLVTGGNSSLTDEERMKKYGLRSSQVISDEQRNTIYLRNLDWIKKRLERTRFGRSIQDESLIDEKALLAARTFDPSKHVGEKSGQKLTTEHFAQLNESNVGEHDLDQAFRYHALLQVRASQQKQIKKLNREQAAGGVEGESQNAAATAIRNAPARGGNILGELEKKEVLARAEALRKQKPGISQDALIKQLKLEFGETETSSSPEQKTKVAKAMAKKRAAFTNAPSVAVASAGGSGTLPPVTKVSAGAPMGPEPGGKDNQLEPMLDRDYPTRISMLTRENLADRKLGVPQQTILTSVNRKPQFHRHHLEAEPRPAARDNVVSSKTQRAQVYPSLTLEQHQNLGIPIRSPQAWHDTSSIRLVPDQKLKPLPVTGGIPDDLPIPFAKEKYDPASIEYPPDAFPTPKHKLGTPPTPAREGRTNSPLVAGGSTFNLTRTPEEIRDATNAKIIKRLKHTIDKDKAQKLLGQIEQASPKHLEEAYGIYNQNFNEPINFGFGHNPRPVSQEPSVGPNSRSATFEQISGRRANLEVQKRGGIDRLSDATVGKIGAQQANRAFDELARANYKLIKSINKGINPAEAWAKATEEAKKAQDGLARVIQNKEKQILGSEHLVVQAEGRGISPTGAYGRFRRGVNQTFGGIGNYFRSASDRFAGTSLGTAIGHTIADQRVTFGLAGVGAFAGSKVAEYAGDPRIAYESGQGTRYVRTKAVGGALTGAAAGFALGAQTGNPMVVAATTAAGALMGMAQAASQAKVELAEINSARATSIASERTNRLARSEIGDKNHDRDVDQFLASVGEKRKAYAAEGMQKSFGTGIETSFNYLFNRDSLTEQYRGIHTDAARRANSEAAPVAMMELSRQAEFLGGKNAHLNNEQILALLKSDKKNQEHLRIVTSGTERSEKDVLDDLVASINKSKVRTISEVGLNVQVHNFNQLAQAAQAASNSLGTLKASSQGLSAAFQGQISGLHVSLHGENLNTLGRFDRGSLNPLRFLATIGGNTGKELLAQGEAVDDISRILPRVLGKHAKLGVNDKEQLANQVRAAIADDLKARGKLVTDANGDVIGGMTEHEDVLNRIHARITKLSSDQLLEASNNPSRIANQILQPEKQAVAEPAQNALQLVQHEFDTLSNSLVNFRQKLQTVGESLNRQAGIHLEGLRVRAQFAAEDAGTPRAALDRLSLKKLNAPFQERQEYLTGLKGNRALDANLIGRRLKETMAELGKIPEQEKRARTSGAPNSAQTLAGLQAKFVNLSGTAVNLQTALKNLASEARNAAAQEKLAHLNQERNARLGFAARYATADFDERIRMQRGAALTAQAQQTGSLDNFLPQERKEILEFLNSVENIKLSTPQGRVYGGDLRDQLLRKSFGGIANLTDEDERERQGLRKQILAGEGGRQEASKQLTNNLQDIALKFNVNVKKTFDDFIKNFEAALAKMPGAQHHAAGGSIFQPRGTDTVPAMLTPGEFVVNRDSAQANLPLLKKINASKGKPVYRAGGGPIVPKKSGTLNLEEVNRKASMYNVTPLDEYGRPTQDEEGRPITHYDFPTVGSSWHGRRKTQYKAEGGAVWVKPEDPRAFRDWQNRDRLRKQEDQYVRDAREDELFVNSALENAGLPTNPNVIAANPKLGRMARAAIDRAARRIFRRNRARDIRQQQEDRLRAKLGPKRFAQWKERQKRIELDREVARKWAATLHPYIKEAVANPGGASALSLMWGGPRQKAFIRHMAGARNLYYRQIMANAHDVYRPGLEEQHHIGVGMLTRQQELNNRAARRDHSLQRFIGSLVQDQYIYRGPFGYRMASGGPVPGSGFGDKIPALLEPGEFVLNRRAANKAGVGNLQRFNSGGLVGGGNNNTSSSSPGLLNLSQQALQAFASFNQASQGFSHAVTIFSGQATALGDAISKMPKSITLQGTQTVQVVINGAEVLSQLTPEIQKLVEEKTVSAFQQIMKEKMPDAGLHQS